MAYIGTDLFTGNATVAENVKLPTTTSTTGQIIIGGNPSLHTFGTENLFVGTNAGNLTLSGSANCALGFQTMEVLTNGGSNCAVGVNSCVSLTSGSTNCAFGINSLENLVSGNANCALGFSNSNGGAGLNYTGAESNNIVISNTGVTGDNGVIRIGDGDQTTCFIAGIAGVTVASSAPVLINTSTGQLGTIASTQRLKENIQPMTDTKILNLKPVTFTFKNDSSKSKQFGLIAEEVAKEMPELVTVDADGKPYHVSYHLMPSILLYEMKKLIKRIEVLEAKGE